MENSQISSYPRSTDLIRVSRPQWGKKRLLSKWCWKFIYKSGQVDYIERMKLALCITSHTKIKTD
jgi:hypothetical protein